MTKEEVIKQAYGEHWETLKDFVDENGWVEDLHACTCLFKDTFDGRIISRIFFIDLEIKSELITEFFRPKSLQGIESNNGWTNIEKDSDLPEQGMRVLGYSKQWIHPDFNPEGIRECHVCGHSLENAEWTSSKWDNNNNCWDADWETNPTHWKNIDFILPIY